MSMNFITREINIEKITEEKLEFLIPVYQRPYVWDDIEIKKLLEDLVHNFRNNADIYFVGNTYVIKTIKGDKNNLYEVIDGQQRFTTFWLISFCFKTLNVDTELEKYLEIEFEKNKDIRFDFDIRKEVYDYLKGLLDGTSDRRFSNVENYEFLKNISKAIETIKGFLQNLKLNEDLKSFGDFIYKKVNFIFNEAPENTDLNALFVALGTSGIQLQQSDILKARLLDKITEKDQRIVYSKVWEACENMINYFEKNVKLSFPYDTTTVSEFDFRNFNTEKFKVSGTNFEENKEIGLKLKDIVGLAEEENINIQSEEIKNSDCRSIISFSVFLFHTLRIYRKQKNIESDLDSMDPKKLLKVFNIDEIDDVPAFISLMWKIRYHFDKHVVKWLKDENESIDEEEKLLLSYINTSTKEDKSYFSRKEKEFTNIQMLQSVLYFTGIFTQQYWLTPFLYFLLKNEDNKIDDEEILKELERIDNIMIPGDKKDMSWEILNEKSDSNFEIDINKQLNQTLGTSFNHYWFYKLEYLLWKNFNNGEDQKFRNYRITSKNSIEHVFPQNEESKNILTDLNDDIDYLNSFGNLALLSVGQNSSYSNQDVNKKKIDFNNKVTYDSLKLVDVYGSSQWNSVEIKNHQEEMILLLENHYKL